MQKAGCHEDNMSFFSSSVECIIV